MPISWNGLRHNAVRISLEWTGATYDGARKQTYWNEFSQFIGVTHHVVASLEKPLNKMSRDYGERKLIEQDGSVLTPGHYVGTEEVEGDGEPFAAKISRLVVELNGQFTESANEVPDTRVSMTGNRRMRSCDARSFKTGRSWRIRLWPRRQTAPWARRLIAIEASSNDQVPERARVKPPRTAPSFRILP